MHKRANVLSQSGTTKEKIYIHIGTGSWDKKAYYRPDLRQQGKKEDIYTYIIPLFVQSAESGAW